MPNATIDDRIKSPRETTRIWWAYAVLTAILLVVLSVRRMSPFGWFPIGYGAVLGLIIVFLPLVLRAELGTGRDWHLMLIAAVGACIAILLAADRFARQEPPALTGAAAELIRQFEATSPGITGPLLKPQSGFARYFTVRYGSEATMAHIAGLALEAGLAAGACWGAVRFARWKFPGVASESPP